MLLLPPPPPGHRHGALVEAHAVGANQEPRPRRNHRRCQGRRGGCGCSSDAAAAQSDGRGRRLLRLGRSPQGRHPEEETAPSELASSPSLADDDVARCVATRCAACAARQRKWRTSGRTLRPTPPRPVDVRRLLRESAGGTLTPPSPPRPSACPSPLQCWHGATTLQTRHASPPPQHRSGSRLANGLAPLSMASFEGARA